MEKTLNEIIEAALVIYNESMCGGAGCCGDIDGALEYVQSSVEEFVQQSVNIAIEGEIVRHGLKTLDGY